ncbi:MAG: asparagine--tRNA ligase [Cytophagales bacterium]|nr:asparagine--tRNA ligase [Cytophagales bacterium]
MRKRIKELLSTVETGAKVTVKGWVRTKRGSKNVAFVALNDGSTLHSLQAVIEVEKFGEDLLKQITTGAALSVDGILEASQGGGQKFELVAEEITILGLADADSYPIQPKKHSLEFLREKAHLRLRTNTFGAIMRVRHQLAYAVHKFFHEQGFYYFHSPIITGSDCEGAGEMFHITNFDLNNIPHNENGIAYEDDFFGKPVHLTVSGQLEGELGAMSLGQVYTFGPTFRAENSNTSRHLAEFWMIEPEVAFNDLEDNMNLAESFIKFVINETLTNCQDDLLFLEEREVNEQKSLPQAQRSEMSLLERLRFVVENDFIRITYTEAVKELLNSKPHKKGKFEYPVEWGIDLQSEHERYLVEKKYKKPVIITDYPKDIKAFYMKLNDDGKTVGAMDVLFPGIGEIIGGSEREANLDTLLVRMEEVGIPSEELDWYLDTRRFGTAPHAGFGLGFERLVLFVTGMTNIRDVIPFPRTPQNANF